MMRFAWFKLGMRLAGIVVIGFAIPDALQAVVSLAYVVLQPQTSVDVDDWWYVMTLLPPMLQTGLGLYLLLGGKWLLQLCLRGIDTICPACAYDLSAVTSDTCPECGFRFRPLPTHEPSKNAPVP